MERQIKIEFEIVGIQKISENGYLLMLKRPDLENTFPLTKWPLTEKQYEELERPTISDKITMTITPIEGTTGR